MTAAPAVLGRGLHVGCAEPIVIRQAHLDGRLTLLKCSGCGCTHPLVLDPEIHHDELQVAADAMSAWGLTPTEGKLFAVLHAERPTVVGHEQLLRRVWGPSYEGEWHLLRVALARLRTKLRERGAPWRLENTPTLGYRLVDAEPADTVGE